MAGRKSKVKSRKTQARNKKKTKKEPNKIKRAVTSVKAKVRKAVDKTRTKITKTKARSIKKTRGAKDKSRASSDRKSLTTAAKLKRVRERTLKHNLRRLIQVGLYSPKYTYKVGRKYKYRKVRQPISMTPARAKTIIRLTRDQGHLADAGTNFFIPIDRFAPDKRAGIITRIQQLGFTANKKGIFIPREKDTHKFEKFAVKYNKKRDRYEILLTRRIKSGKGRGAVERTIIPIARTDELSRNYDQLSQLLADNPINKKQRYRFIINLGANPGNMSRRAFTTIEQLWRYLMQYRDKEADKIELVENIAVVVVNGGGPPFKKVIKVLDDSELDGEIE